MTSGELPRQCHQPRGCGIWNLRSSAKQNMQDLHEQELIRWSEVSSTSARNKSTSRVRVVVSPAFSRELLDSKL